MKFENVMYALTVFAGLLLIITIVVLSGCEPRGETLGMVSPDTYYECDRDKTEHFILQCIERTQMRNAEDDLEDIITRCELVSKVSLCAKEPGFKLCGNYSCSAVSPCSQAKSKREKQVCPGYEYENQNH